MITYDLALQLKEAGFPQTGEGEFSLSIPKDKERNLKNVIRIYYPTLSELIEECDKKCGDFAIFSHGSSWVCGDFMPYEHDWIERSEGINLEDALVNLWLALNKK